MGDLLLYAEAEGLVESLHTLDVVSVGTGPWLRQREHLEQLTLQAHQSARQVAAAMGYSSSATAAMAREGGPVGEFVKELLISCDKVEVIIHELLVIEAWRDSILPHLLSSDSAIVERSASSMNLQLVCGHEVTLVSLLEVALYHRDTWDCVTDDEILLELVDYCCRRVVYLNSDQATEDVRVEELCSTSAAAPAKEILKISAMQEHEARMKEWRFKAAIAALSILRYLTQYMSDLHPCVMARLLDANDTIAALVTLADKRPWIRRRRRHNNNAKSNKERPVIVETFEDGQWREVSASDRLRVTKPDAQMWLGLYNMILEPMARNKYQYDDHRRETVSRLRKHFTEVFLDQLPILQHLQRAVEEIAMMTTPSTGEIKQGRLIMQQVPMIYERILHSATQNRERIVADLCKTVFGDSEEARSSNKSYMDSVLRNIDFLINLEPEAASGKATMPTDGKRDSNNSTRGEGGVDENGHRAGEWQVIVDAMRLSPTRVWQTCIQGLQFHTKQRQQQDSSAPNKLPEAVEIKNHQGEKITGHRHRLYSLATRAHKQKQHLLPFDGKLCVRVTTPEGKVLDAEEALNLPTIHHEIFQAAESAQGENSAPASTCNLFDGCPETIWVTVGLLAADGFALQLKLARPKSLDELRAVMSPEKGMESEAAAETDGEEGYRDPVSTQMYLYRVLGGLLSVRSTKSSST